MITDSVPLPIEFLPCDSQGTIVEMCGRPCQVQRLEELGIRQGCKVRVGSAFDWATPLIFLLSQLLNSVPHEHAVGRTQSGGVCYHR